VKVHDLACLNCGHPLTGHEKFCPECGQKNKGSKITFLSFLKEVFNGFISLDAKVWTTLIPLLIKPGKVSRDFITGKRARYTNPFQFYISVSIIFFLILGAANKYRELQEFTTGKTSSNNFNLVNFDDGFEDGSKEALKVIDSLAKNPNIDSIIQNIDLEDKLKDLDSVERENALKILQVTKDSLNNVDLSEINLDSIKGESRLLRMIEHQEKYPNHSIDQALDSLKMEKTFWNRFVYTRADKINGFRNNSEEEQKKISKELVSYASISIFIFLPIFTLFLRLIYIRRAFTYVEHLIFVFHTQTVFFLLATIFFILWLATHSANISAIFALLFLIYLFIAMKKFYQQGFFKTFFKFCMINFIFMIMSIFGLVIVSVIAFAIY
jgi:hypothetical protein